MSEDTLAALRNNNRILMGEIINRTFEIRELADQLILMDPLVPGLTDEQRKYRQSESLVIRAKIARLFKELD